MLSSLSLGFLSYSLRRFTRSEETSDSYGKMGAGRKSSLLQKLVQNQTVIKVLPTIPGHYDGRKVDFATKENTYGASDKSVLINNKKRFDKIEALPVDAKDSANPLREKMAKKLHTVQVLPVLPKNFVLGQLKRKADSPDSNRESEKGALAGEQKIHEKTEVSPFKSTEKKTNPLTSTVEKKPDTLGIPLAATSSASVPKKTMLGVKQLVGSRSKSDRSVVVDSKERPQGSQSPPTQAKSSLAIGEESGVLDSNKIQKDENKIDSEGEKSLVETVRQRRLSLSHSFHDMSSNSSLSEGETVAPHGKKKKRTKRRSSPRLEGAFEPAEILRKSESRESIKERIKDRRRMSQGLPELSKSSASSLEEDGEGTFIDVGSSHDEIKRDLIDSTKKRRRTSQGLPVSAQSSTSNSEGEEVVKSRDTHGAETQELGGSHILIEGVKNVLKKIVTAVKLPGMFISGQGTSATSRNSLSSTDIVHVKVEDAEDVEIDSESEMEMGRESDNESVSFHSLGVGEDETD